ncbi:uncharacterized protein LOC116348822 [Contarinia nasturtii]|uniref:uncharacterized protein LOC116348822 n=1 Tax=Contarinia nasturtii TaxID=265458 RepID=UPI0012D384DE|nr:uncharacterized protein LOC116348822 [Contarinia nasturtii]
MGFPTVSRFCCCCDLRTGGLIVGWIGVVSSILYILQSLITGNVYGIGMVIQLVLCACWIYGIKENQPGYLLISVILDGIGLIILYIGVAFMIPALFVIFTSSDKSSEASTIKVIFVITFIGLCIFSAVVTYFWIVMYSVYKHIKDTTSGSTSPKYTTSGYIATSPA